MDDTAAEQLKNVLFVRDREVQSTSELKELRLRKKLIMLFFVFSLVPLTIVGVGAYVVGKGLIYNSVVSHLQNIVLAKTRVVETFLNERDSDLCFLVDLVSRNGLMKQDILTKQMHNMLARKKMYKRIEIIDTSTEILAAYGCESVARDCSYRQECLTATLRGKEYVGSIFLWKKNMVPALAMCKPIRGKSGQVEMAVIAYISFEQVGSHLRKFEFGKTGEAYLIDQQGRFLTKTRLGGRLLQDTIPEVSKDIYLGRPEISEHTDYRGITVIRVSERIPQNNWILIAELDAKEAFVGIRSLGIAIIVLWCVVLLLVSLTAFAISNAVSARLRERYHQVLDLKVYSENIVATLPMSVAVLDKDLNLLSGNRVFLECFSLKAEEAQGTALKRIINNRDLLAGLRRTIETGLVFDKGALELDLGDNGTRFFNAKAASLHIDDETQLLLILNDVTEHRQMEEQVQKAEHLSSLGTLTAGVAHELNTPLANVLLYTQMALEEIGNEDKKLVDNLKAVEEEARRGAAIVKELLEFSRQSDLETNIADINEILDNLLALVDNQCRLNKIKLVKNFDYSIPRIRIDLGRIQQVLMNLVSNAIWAMNKGGTLIIKTGFEKEKQLFVISISDTGIGIPKDNIGKIFNPFFSTKPPSEGTGLGLSVSHGIIKKMGGDILASSISASDQDKTPDQETGTTFVIELPAGDFVIEA